MQRLKDLQWLTEMQWLKNLKRLPDNSACMFSGGGGIAALGGSLAAAYQQLQIPERRQHSGTCRFPGDCRDTAPADFGRKKQSEN
jgi:hypothetical protein